MKSTIIIISDDESSSSPIDPDVDHAADDRNKGYHNQDQNNNNIVINKGTSRKRVREANSKGGQKGREERNEQKDKEMTYSSDQFRGCKYLDEAVGEAVYYRPQKVIKRDPADEVPDHEDNRIYTLILVKMNKTNVRLIIPNELIDDSERDLLEKLGNLKSDEELDQNLWDQFCWRTTYFKHASPAPQNVTPKWDSFIKPTTDARKCKKIIKYTYFL